MKKHFFNKTLPGRINDGIDIILKIFFVFIILMGAYILFDKYYVYSLSERGSLTYSTHADPVEELEQTFNKAIAWLHIDETLDEPLMQGVNNTEYLNKGPDGQYSLRGSLYIDSRNKADFTDDYTLVYGHHMSYYQMFGALDHYFDDDYWTDKHTNGKITLKDGTIIPFTIFAVGSIDASVSEIFQPTENNIQEILQYLNNQNDLSKCTLQSISDISGKRIICFSTCQSPESTLRTCVFAYTDKTLILSE